jgi:phenylpropionate dioxygenase-like ring-hydroxylating dioxygenase large terminal subunit
MHHIFLRNCWHVAAWSHEVGENLLARTLLGEPVCLFRDDRGDIAALADRCAHRGAPLSLGRREADGLRCMYHGVKFGRQGQCIEVPGQSRLPPALCVKAYPVVERHRWIWIWMGDPSLADAGLIPDTWPLGHPEWPYRPGYYHYRAPHMLICDNLLDFSHLAYLHPTTLGGTTNIAREPPEVQVTAQGLRIERWLLNDVPAPFHTRLARFEGPVDRWHFYDFLAPGILIMHSGVQAAVQAAVPGAPPTPRPGALEFRSCQAITPETTTTSHYLYANPRNFATGDPAVTETIYRDVVTAFEEDRVMIEAQWSRLSGGEGTPFTAIRADSALIQFRRLMQRHLDEEQAVARTLPAWPGIPLQHRR